MEFLIFAESSGVDEDFHRGDIIDVRGNGFDWGTEEFGDPLFRIVHIPTSQVGLTVRQARRRFTGGLTRGPNREEAPLRRHQFRILAGRIRRKNRIGTDDAPVVEEVDELVVTETDVDQPIPRRPRRGG